MVAMQAKQDGALDRDDATADQANEHTDPSGIFESGPFVEQPPGARSVPPAPPPASRSGSSSLPPPPPPGTRTRTSVPPPPPPPLPRDVADLRNHLQRANRRSHELLIERVRLEKQLSARDADIRSLRLELDAARAKAADVRQPVAETAGPGDEIAQLRAKVAELELRLTAASATGHAPGPSLAQVSGIGPTFRTRLAEQGVDLAAVAAWTEADVDRVAKAIGTQPGRIRRQAWIAQARELLAAAN